MSDFKAKMHKIRFPLGLRPARPPAGGTYSAPREPLAEFNGTYFCRDGGGEERGNGRGGKRRGTGGKGRGQAPKYFGLEQPLQLRSGLITAQCVSV